MNRPNQISDAVKLWADYFPDRSELIEGTDTLNYSLPRQHPATETSASTLHHEKSVINVRRARLSDYPQIAAFIHEAYGELAPFKAEDRWKWQFANNPYIRFYDGTAPVWIAETGGKVVGQIAVQEGMLQIDGVQHPAGWIVDVMVLPSYRGKGLGHKLYAAVAKDCPILVTLTMAQTTRRIAKKFGAINIGQVKLYAHWIRFDSHTVQRYLQARTSNYPRINWMTRRLCSYLFVHHILAGAGNALLSLKNALFRVPRNRRSSQIVKTNWFDSEVDRLWDRVSCDFPAAFTRGSKFLNWRFRECPQMKYQCFTASRDGNLVGYLVLRQTEPVELPQGIIVDLLAAPGDRSTIEDLVSFAREYFGNNVATIECATSIPEYANALRRFGFQSVQTERPNCVVAEKTMRERLEKHPADWLFSKADHDWDQIHLA